MPVTLEPATTADAATIAALRTASAADLVARHGPGPWAAGHCSEKGALHSLRHAQVFLIRTDGETVGTLQLGTTKPWAIDRRFFSKVARPLYLTSMCIRPDLQRRGLGRASLALVTDLARVFPADAVFLDAYDYPAAGAGEFYRRCGYRETGRVTYRSAPLIYFELLL